MMVLPYLQFQLNLTQTVLLHIGDHLQNVSSTNIKYFLSEECGYKGE